MSIFNRDVSAPSPVSGADDAARLLRRPPQMNSNPVPTAVAPMWHTAVVVVILVSFSVAAALSKSLTPLGAGHSRIPSYVLIIVLEWALVAWIHAVTTTRGVSLRDLIGDASSGIPSVLRDVGIAVAFLVVAILLIGALGRILNATPGAGLRNVIPRTSLEVAFFLVTAVTAGCCEEVIFRGYLLRQFTAVTRSTAAGVGLQAVVFGVAHGYQGWKYMLMITFFGSLFGLLAIWRKSLRPGMIAHFVQDGIGGLVARHVLR